VREGGASAASGREPRRDLRWRREYAFFRLWLGGSLLIPRPLHRLLARPIVRVLEWCLPATTAAIRGNLRRALALPAGTPPARAEREVRRRARRALLNYGSALFDHAWLTLGPRPRLRELVGRVRGGERIREALAGGRGAILASAHLGLWDLGARALAEEGLPLSVLAGAGGDPRANRYRDRARRRLGIEVLWVEAGRAGALSLLGPLRALERGRVLAILGDRPTGGGLARVRFFGEDADFPLGPAALARASGAPLLPAFVALDERTLRYDLTIEPPIEVPRGADRAADHLAATRALARVFERWIRAYPEQWYDFYPFWEGRSGLGFSP
jgi:KDO2-lipid IV(A) lauroyltransferase